HGRPLSPNGLAKLLIPFGIYPRTIRVGEATARGYLCEIFDDASRRYLRSSSGATSTPTTLETQQSPQCSAYEGKSHFSEPQHSLLVADEKSDKLPMKTRVVSAVAVNTLNCAPQRTNWPVEGE